MQFVVINDQILNLDRVIRVERSQTEGDRLTVHVYFAGGDQTPAIYTDAPAAAIWERFRAIAQNWPVPSPVPFSPPGAGRVDDRQP